ncbi:MAG: GNAT family protein [Vicinamibacterales bacterium]
MGEDKRSQPAPAAGAPARSWRDGLPVLSAGGVTLRELRLEDAPALAAHLGTAEIARFLAPPPATVAGFEEFIVEAHRERIHGQAITYGVVPDGHDHVVGVFQLRSLEAGFGTAEWTCMLASAYWGTGLFLESARLVMAFAFDTVGILRLEARAVTMDGRGNGALRKVGAVQEGVLRRSFKRNGQRYDQLLWAVLAEDWRLQKRDRPRVH